MKEKDFANKTVIAYSPTNQFMSKIMVIKFGKTPEDKEILFKDICIGSVTLAISDLKKKYPKAEVITFESKPIEDYVD